jgi:hypothetical protein
LFFGATLAAFVGLATDASGHPGLVPAQDDPVVSAEPENNPARLGDEFDLFIFIDGADDLAAFQFTLEYDDSYLEYVSADMGPFLGTSGRQVIEIGPEQVPGSVTFAGIALPQGSAPGANGSGDLAIVRFKAIALGETTLDLTEVLLEQSDTSKIEVDGVDAVLTITDVEPTPTEPTVTPTPTGGPPGDFVIFNPFADKG